jgi:hypothetical protein
LDRETRGREGREVAEKEKEDRRMMIVKESTKRRRQTRETR